MASLFRRIATKADALAAGTAEPAGLDSPDPDVRRPSARERGRMRRRLRRLVRMRDAKLRELGGIVLELQRLGRENAELVEQRSAELRAIDDEARELAAALRDERMLAEVLAAGVSGACGRCATLMSTQDSFCPNCGSPAGDAPKPSVNTANGKHATTDGSPTQELQRS